MPRGEKSGNPKMKRHRAARIAGHMRARGVPRAEANRIATAAMDREYAGVGRGPEFRKSAVDEEARDSRSGQRKTNLTTKNPSVSGVRDVASARRPGASKRMTGKTGQAGSAVGGRKPRVASTPGTRASSRKAAAATRQTIPRKAAGYRPPAAHKKEQTNRSTAVRQEPAKRTPRSRGPGSAGTARKPAMSGRQSTAKKSSGVSRTA